MNFLKKYRIHLLLAVVALVFAVALFVSLKNLNDLQTEITNVPLAQGVWATSQGEGQLLRLLDSLQAYRRGAPAVDEEAVLTRLDIVWSRIAVFESGDVGAYAMAYDDFEPTIKAFKSALEKVDGLFERLSPETAGQAYEILRPFVKPLHGILIAVAQEATRTRAAEKARAHDVLTYLMASILVVLVCGTIMVVLLVRQTMQADREAEKRKQMLIEFKHAEEQLRQAQKMEAVGQLTGGVAHDFNNLLAAIIGNLEMAQERSGKDTELADLLARAFRAAERGADLTQRLLAFSRKQALRPSSIDVGALLSGIVSLLERTLGRTIGVKIEQQTGLWSCRADSSQLESAVLNLALNARHAMPEGGVLEISASNTTLEPAFVEPLEGVEAGDYVVISVKDPGCGMSATVRDRAFEPFFTTKDVGEGSGLGLSMVYGFVKQSRGHVTIDSRENEGTEVRLYLPRAEDHEPAQASTPTGEAPRGGGETILLVEDEPEVRELAVRTLTSLGYRVIEAGDGPEALSRIDGSRKIDLLLSDVILPGRLSGPDLAARIRQQDPNVRVLYISGYQGGALAHLGKHDMSSVLVNKPFRRQELAEHVRNLLDTPV